MGTLLVTPESRFSILGDSMASPLADEYGIACTALRRYGIHEKKVIFCPVDLMENGTVCFRIKREFGHTAQWASFPIGLAQANREYLIGFVFRDGTIRDDAEMLCSSFGTIDVPIYVCLWQPSVPKSERVRVASGEARASQRPTIIIP